MFLLRRKEISISRIEWIKDVYIVGIFFLYFLFFVISFLINFKTLFHDNGQESSDSSSLRELRPNLRKVRPVIESTKRISSKFKAGPVRGRKRKSKKREREREERKGKLEIPGDEINSNVAEK